MMIKTHWKKGIWNKVVHTSCDAQGPGFCGCTTKGTSASVTEDKAAHQTCDVSQRPSPLQGNPLSRQCSEPPPQPRQEREWWLLTDRLCLYPNWSLFYYSGFSSKPLSGNYLGSMEPRKNFCSSSESIPPPQPFYSDKGAEWRDGKK